MCVHVRFLRMQNHIYCTVFFMPAVYLAGGRISTMIHAIKELGVNTEYRSSSLAAAVEQRLAQLGVCDCHHSVLLFHEPGRDSAV